MRIREGYLQKGDLRNHFQNQRWWNSRWHVAQRWPCMPCKSGSHGLILPYSPFDASSPHRGCQDHEQQHQYITRCLSRLYRNQRKWRSASAAFASHEYLKVTWPPCKASTNEVWLGVPSRPPMQPTVEITSIFGLNSPSTRGQRVPSALCHCARIPRSFLGFTRQQPSGFTCISVTSSPQDCIEDVMRLKIRTNDNIL